MKDRPDISRLLEFNTLVIKLRSIKRKVNLPPDAKEPENDIEHSYGLAMMAWFLAQYFPEINTNKVIRIALVHDMLEVHAGDTFSYASPKELDGKKKREARAKKQLAKEWPDFKEMHEEIAEYEDRQTKEAKFVYALDKLQPALHNYQTSGQVWHKYHISFDDFKAEKDSKIPPSKEINEYYQQLLELLRVNPQMLPPLNSKKVK